jgi:hypothetical protein
MILIKYFLALSSVLIYLFTAFAIYSQGLNWPSVAINDLVSLNWRSQFNFDFVIHLFLVCAWVVWREGATKRGYIFGFLSVFLGGMFSFPYIIYATVKAKGNAAHVLLGVHSQEQKKHVD